ncbi:MAG: cysteine desulfurase family protein, partial [Phycisphaerae bacterium]
MASQTKHPIYMDYNATTPVLPEVLNSMLPFLRKQFGNPSSDHAYGRPARAAVERARGQVAELLRCAADEIVFTSGGTEANNLAIRGVMELSIDRRHIVTSVVEHPATVQPCAWLESQGIEVTRVPVNRTGHVEEQSVRAALRPDTALVTIMLAQNETGAVMPVARIAELAHRHGAVIHTDAAQAIGKIPVHVDRLQVDLLSIAGHKLYAPKGIGTLYVRGGTFVAPLIRGAGQERGLRPGTENVPYIVGLGVACELAAKNLLAESHRQRELRDELWRLLRADIAGLKLVGGKGPRLPNTLNICFPDVLGSAVLAAAPEIAASTGSACHAGDEHASAVLLAMGIPVAVALGAVRL